MTGATVISNSFSKLTRIYPYKTPSSEHTANSVISYFSHYGVSLEIHTDPASVLTSSLVADLNRLYGTKHRFSLVDVHTSNGVEPRNKLILRHLRALLTVDRIKDRWSETPIISKICSLLNNSHNSELSSYKDNLSPFDLTFGTLDKSSFKDLDYSQEFATKYMTDLNNDFKSLHAASVVWQNSIINSRIEKAVLDSVSPGDFVLRNTDKPFRRDKLTYRFQGPYKVTSQHKSDISVQHLALKTHFVFHISTLKLFHGSEEDALHLSMLDADEYWLKAVTKWFGHSDNQKTVRLFLTFEDDTTCWSQFDNELIQTKMVEDFIIATPELYILSFPATLRKKYRDSVNKTAMNIKLGHKGFVDLRFFGFSWYESLDLDDSHDLAYVVEYKIVKILPKFKYSFVVPELDSISYDADNYFISAWGYIKKIDPTKHILVTKALRRQYPKLANA